MRFPHRRLAVALAILCTSCATVSTGAAQYPESLYQELRWRLIGPFRGGRTRAVAGVPSQPNVFYIGVVNGGVWKSDDYGRTWNPIFDDQPTQSIGAIAVAPSDPNIVYVASGEGLHRPDLSVGDGIYRSSDAGKTWVHLGLRDSQQIPALAVDPRDPNRLFAAVLGHPYGPSEERGIYLSTDGGKTWQRTLGKDANTGGSDIEMDPQNPDILYAGLWEAREGPWDDNNLFNGTGGGLFKSTDGGKTWRSLGNGLPSNIAQVNIAIAPSRPSRVYLTLATDQPGEYAKDTGLGVFRSDDAGEHWVRATSDPRPAMRIGGGDLPVPRVDPKNPDTVYSTSIVTVKSVDGGNTWVSLRGAPGGDDYQNLWINPRNPDILLLASDQGALVTVNGGATWSSWYNQPTAQLYHVSATNTFPYKVCSGQQESGSVCISSRGNDGSINFRDWHPVGTIEYGYVAPDPLDPDVIYGGGRSEVSKFHWSTGQTQIITPIPVQHGQYRANRTQPIMFSPADPHTLFYATNVLFKTKDGGDTWETISPDLTRADPGVPGSVGKLVLERAKKQRGVIYALAPSFKDVNTLWAGTDDGQLWNTFDGGKNWTNITPQALIPWSKVTQISASHFDEQTAFASISRFRVGDLHPYILRTRDGGKSWHPIAVGLPDSPVDTVREDPVQKGLLFAGTENAVWVSFDDGDHWQPLQLNLPHTAMRDLLIQGDDLVVATHGRSFWILDDITPLRQVAEAVKSSKPFLFNPASAYRVQRNTNTDTPIPADEPTGENPPDGAVIDYVLPSAVEGVVTLEIVDSRGGLVRRYASDDPPEITREELERELIPRDWLRAPKNLKTTAGMHRWVWDLHYPAPVAAQHEFPISATPHDTPRAPLGPTALPGRYTVRLTAAGQTSTATFEVKMDPRVKTPSSGLEQKFKLEMQLASIITDSSQALTQARSCQEQLKKLSQTSAEAAAALKRLETLLGTSDTSVATLPTVNTVNSEAGSLYGPVAQADAAPTMAQSKAGAAIVSDAQSVLKAWSEFKTRDIPALNSRLKSAGKAELHVD